MAKRGFDIDVGMNAREFQRGTKDVEGALEDVADALDDVAKDSDKAGDKLGDNLSDGAKDAEKSVERLERSFKDLADGSKRATSSSADALKKNTKEATSSASRDLAELKDEAVQNASETFSSFDGSAESFVDGIQGTLGGIVSSMGPIGAALGAAGALGIGMMMGQLEEGSEEAEEMRGRISDLAAEFIETGGIGKASLEGVVERLKELATTTDENKQNLADLYTASASAVNGFKRIADAYAGNEEQLDSLIGAEKERLETLRRAAAEDKGWDLASTQRKIKLRDGQQDIVDGLEDAAEAAEGARVAEEAWLASSGPALEARIGQMETLQGELDDAIGSWSEYYDAETGATDPGAYINNMRKRMEATANFNSNVQKLASDFGLSYDEMQSILDEGVDFAPMLQSIIDSGMGEEYAGQVRSMLSGGQSIIDGTPLHATVTADGDVSKAQADLDKAATPRTAKITPQVEGGTAKIQLEDTAKPRAATVTAKAATGDASTQLDKAANKNRTATITAKADVAAANRQLQALATQRRTVDVGVNADTRAAARALDQLANSYRSTTVYVDVVERRAVKYRW